MKLPNLRWIISVVFLSTINSASREGGGRCGQYCTHFDFLLKNMHLIANDSTSRCSTVATKKKQMNLDVARCKKTRFFLAGARCGVKIYSRRSLLCPGRGYRLPERTVSAPLLPKGNGRTASNQYKRHNTHATLAGVTSTRDREAPLHSSSRSLGPILSNLTTLASSAGLRQRTHLPPSVKVMITTPRRGFSARIGISSRTAFLTPWI